MNDLVITSPAQMPVTAQYKADLMAGEFIIAYDRVLVPVEALNAIVAEVESAMMNADKETIINGANFLVGAFPQNNFKDKDPEIYIKSLVFCMADYPEDIIRSGTMEIIKKQKWLPSIAEVVETLDRIKFARTSILMRAKNQLNEHKKRDAEKMPAITEEQRQRNKAHYEKYTGKS